MDIGVYETYYLAQSHWHFFRYRVGEMTGLNRERRSVKVAPFVDEDGDQVTPEREFSYDTLVLAVGSQTNDFGTPGAKEHAISLETPGQAERFHRLQRVHRAHAQASRYVRSSCRCDHRRRRDWVELAAELLLRHGRWSLRPRPHRSERTCG
jgi:NADH dehydrogenase